MNRLASQKKARLALTEEAFDRLLRWLDPDRQRAGEIYEEIRLRLIKIFVARGCLVPEDLADKTIDRVVEKASVVVSSYKGNPALYFYGVARMIHLEHLREKPVLPPPSFPAPEGEEQRYACFEQCLERLSLRNRQLILAYYGETSAGKGDQRKALATATGMEPNALWVRVHRIRERLRRCVGECLHHREQN